MKAKIMIRILAALLMSLVLSVAAGISCYASATDENIQNVGDTTLDAAENPSEVDSYTQNPEDTDDNVENISLNAIFSELYSFASEYASEIISTVTLAGTLVVGFAYKKGLIPMLGKVTGNIQSAVVKIKENTEESNRSASERLDGITDRLGCVENSLTLAAGSIERLEEKLASEEKEIACRRMMDTVMRSQVDMLYDIFMASALPQYQKDAVGMRIQKMREELSKYEESVG